MRTGIGDVPAVQADDLEVPVAATVCPEGKGTMRTLIVGTMTSLIRYFSWSFMTAGPPTTVARTLSCIRTTLDELDLSPERWDDNGGWGLGIMATLATNCGYTTDPNGGKWVWAALKP